MITSGTLLPLDQLRPNEVGNIVEMVGCPVEIRRLAELGLGVGASIRMVRPGSPCVLSVGTGVNRRLSLRLSENVDILVSAVVPQ
ncbi:MAG: ferrous iron transport protein A [Planctomycetota bacterium]|nr:MAG: ferrous iron transport protein A [Planctomycetota bacterium]